MLCAVIFEIFSFHAPMITIFQNILLEGKISDDSIYEQSYYDGEIYEMLVLFF